ncbi:MAG: hypothetical protein J6Y78_04120 [Paludibacteraceae bacterium]|nr:hypothetical protein [Paludibacteraceae bacterium]
MTPVRLDKQQEVEPMFLDLDERIERFAMKYGPIILLVCTILLMVLLIALCFVLFGNGTMESTIEYNNLKNII